MLQVRSKAVIYELLDNEMILADLDTGIYYSIRESGIPIWQLLVAGYTTEEITALFREKYTDPCVSEILPFIHRLQEEGLLVPAASEARTTPQDLFWPPYPQSPLLERHEEMKDLLMLDPIHEVDEQGWPVKGELV